MKAPKLPRPVMIHLGRILGQDLDPLVKEPLPARIQELVDRVAQSTKEVA